MREDYYGPTYHSDSADGEHLDVKVTDTRIQLDAHPEVVEETAVDGGVSVGGIETALSTKERMRKEDEDNRSRYGDRFPEMELTLM